MTNKTL